MYEYVMAFMVGVLVGVIYKDVQWRKHWAKQMKEFGMEKK